MIMNNEMLYDKDNDLAMNLVMQNGPLLHILACRNSELLKYNNQKTFHMHYNNKGHWVASSSVGNSVILI